LRVAQSRLADRESYGLGDDRMPGLMYSRDQPQLWRIHTERRYCLKRSPLPLRVHAGIGSHGRAVSAGT